jgi:HSP20 family protein
MSFFVPQAYLSPTNHSSSSSHSHSQDPEPTLLDILSLLDSPTNQRAPHRPQTYTPHFDIVEAPEAYELYGEVPGLEREDLSVEFVDAQTLVVKGRVGRVPAQGPVATSETEAERTGSENAPSHAATVEDDYDEADTPLSTPSTAGSSTAAPSSNEKGKEREVPLAQPVQPEQEPRGQYHLAERKVGEFERKFHFKKRVEADFVTAGLRNGVVSVVVPKSLGGGKVVVSVG